METIKKSIIKRIIIILSLIMTVFITFSCDSPTKPIIKTKQELYAKLNESVVGNRLDIFIKSFSEYELEMIDYQDESQNIIHFSFSDEKIDRNRFIDLFRSDPNVLRVEFEPSTKWRQGELIARLTFIESQQLDRIIEKYSEWGFRTNDISPGLNLHYHFVFDHSLIDDQEFLKMLKQGTGLIVDLLYNVQGRVYIHYGSQPIEDFLDDLLYTYSEYELKILWHIEKYRLIYFSYDYSEIEPFDFIRLLKQYPRILGFDFHRVWSAGELRVTFHERITREIVADFLKDYSEVYGIKLKSINRVSNNIIIEFNHNIHDEVKMLEMIDNDYRVETAGFNFWFFL